MWHSWALGRYGVLRIFCIVMLIVLVEAEGAPLVTSDIIEFLRNDTTDQREYSLNYTCGYYSRDLAMNASEHNLTLGIIIFGNDPLFGEYNDTHAMNYVVVYDTIVLIEPQTDRLSRLEDMEYQYQKLYPNTTAFSAEWGEDGIVDDAKRRLAKQVAP